VNEALGRTGILLALLASLAGIATVLVGLKTKRGSLVASGRTYLLLVLLGAVVATVGMERALITHDFRLSYVADNNSLQTPLLYSITGLWSALQGSLLFWGLVLGAFGAAVAIRFRRRAADPVLGWATVVILGVSAFFFALMTGPADPFLPVKGAVPSDGLGPNPLLQQYPLVAFHPPLLYLGFVGLTVPFAFAVGALVTGRVGEGWLAETRRWTLFAWGCLSVGIVLGAWWSYKVLGWGGFWGWDPVENASLLPWICTTAFLHSAMVQERRGILRVWNVSLIMAAFCLSIFGTSLTRSGIVQSVHSFSESSLGPVLFGFLGLVVLVSVGLIAWRGDRLASPGKIGDFVSREGAFLVNNILFGALALVVFLGTLFPLLAEVLDGQQLTVGRPYFDTMAGPIGALILFFMAAAPVLGWRHTNRRTLARKLAVPAAVGAAAILACGLAGLRGAAPIGSVGLAAFAGAVAIQKLAEAGRVAKLRGHHPVFGMLGRSGGGMIVHLGIVMIALGLATSTTFGHRAQVRLQPGQTMTFSGHTLQYLRTTVVQTTSRTETEALVKVDGSSILRPGITQFPGDTEAVGTPSILSSPVDDVYLTLEETSATHGGSVLLGIVVEPLVIWLWIGGITVGFGTMLAIIPERKRKGAGQRGTGTATAGSGDRDAEAEARGGRRVPLGVASGLARAPLSARLRLRLGIEGVGRS